MTIVAPICPAFGKVGGLLDEGYRSLFIGLGYSEDLLYGGVVPVLGWIRWFAANTSIVWDNSKVDT